ncbi:MAG TPA: ABC transporter permease, partial [Vicinamibacterales bacterium]
MTLARLAFRSAAYHWRTNLAVVLGVAAAVAVLGGALLVGDSVRGSLRDIALGRLGRTDQALASTGFFTGDVVERLRARAPDASVTPLIVANAFVTHEPSGRRAGTVVVYGVDEQFWTFHGVPPPDGPVASPALAAELGAQDGDTLLVRLQRPSEIPIESLFGRKEEIGRTVRLTLSAVLPRERLGEFSLRAQQAQFRAVFAPLRRIQRDLGVEDRVNTVLIAGLTDQVAASAARGALSLEDLGINVRLSGNRTDIIVDSTSGILADPVEDAIIASGTAVGLEPVPVFTYLANTMRVRDRVVPYSLVTATTMDRLFAMAPGGPRADSDAPSGATPPAVPIVINDWTARQLSARAGDPLEIDYYLWDANAGLTTHTASFTIASVVPIAGLAADRQLAPEYPGITGAESLADWDPPFPVDLSKIRDIDEKYWDDHRATPKAFIPYQRGRELWSTRYGDATSVRFAVPGGANPDDLIARLREEISKTIRPEAVGLTVQPVRTLAAEASTGATDFGQYFTYFSFFIVVSAVMLAVLFFRLGIEQRLRQIGVLRATGYTVAIIRRLFLIEVVALALLGAFLGLAGAVAYGNVIVYGLRTWWIGAVGTTDLSLHVTPASLAIGAAAGVAASILCVLWSLRAVAKMAPRGLLTAQAIGQEPTSELRIGRRHKTIGVSFAAIAVVAAVAGLVAEGNEAAAFFGAGASALLAAMFLLSAWLRSRPSRVIAGHGVQPVMRLGFR